MTYWTIMWITILTGPLEHVVYGIPFKTEAACHAATRQISDTLDYDHTLICAVTPTASGSIKPRPRPVKE